MPRVLGTTPGWLSRPSPGFSLFSMPPKSSGSSREETPILRPTRTIAQRGTQIFVAIDNEIRWTDLMLLKDCEKDSWTRSRQATPLSVDSIPESLYRTLKVSIPSNIIQLSLSPHGDYLVIVTAHTVHAVILHAHYEMDIGPVKMKSFQVGPSQHVLECAPIASILWHPLGPSGHCLVTLTTDAVVRLWEFDANNRASFSESQLSIDLGKLANATGADEDLSASVFGTGKRFMPDRAYLEPAAACFGGLGRAGESPWSAMTLWITSSEGDVFALCPLIPSKFSASPQLLRNLWDSVAAKRIELENHTEDADLELFQLRQQEDWLRGLEKMDPLVYTTPSGDPIDVLCRPTCPRPEPALQGPFDIGSLDLDVCDIFVRNVKFGEEPLEFETGETLDEEDQESIPMGLSLVTFLTRAGAIHTLLEIDGVEGRWLCPADFDDQDSDRSLVLLHSTSVSPPGQLGDMVCPSITPDVKSAYAFFITHPKGVSYFSMETWVERLRDELEDPIETGSAVRIDVFLETIQNEPSSIITFDPTQTPRTSNHRIPSCVIYHHPELGYLAIASHDRVPYAALLDVKQYDSLQASVMSDSHHVINNTPAPLLLLPSNTREPYQPDNRFYDTNVVSNFIRSLPRQKPHLTQHGIVTAEALNLLITAHQAFASHSYDLTEAASRTWRACNRMLNEYHDQLSQVRAQTLVVNSVTSVDDSEFFDDKSQLTMQIRLQKRLQDALDKQDQLSARAASVSKKLARLHTSQASAKQRLFVKQVQSVEQELKSSTLMARFDEVKELRIQIVKASRGICSSPSTGENHHHHQHVDTLAGHARRVPSTLRKAKMDGVFQSLERESSMIEATTERLTKLNLQL